MLAWRVSRGSTYRRAGCHTIVPGSDRLRDRGKPIGAQEIGQSPLYLDDEAGTGKDQSSIQLYQTSARSNLFISVGGAGDAANSDQRQTPPRQPKEVREQSGRRRE